MADDESVVLNELVRAKESIKRKYIALKSGEDNIQKIISQTFKPIIDPLTELAGTTRASSAVSTQGENISNKPGVDYEISSPDLLQPVKYEVTESQHSIEKWLQSKDLDKIYGPKEHSNGSVVLGGKEIKFEQDALIIRDRVYPFTRGLINLLFFKHPATYTGDDLEMYKQMLIQTSAHLTADKTKIKTGGDKYKNIIAKLFTPSTAAVGSGLTVKLQKHNLVYWDDPNELVDRLRLLLSSQAAGNTGVSNEILSIFEELLEVGLINRIPNV